MLSVIPDAGANMENKIQSDGKHSVRELVVRMCDDDRVVAITAGRALWKVVRWSGRPNAERERAAAAGQLRVLVNENLPINVRREMLWMISEIGGDDSVDVVSPLLLDVELREDARMVLERIPGDKSLAALRTAWDTVSDEFRSHIAQSLRVRGDTVKGYACKKMVPTKSTGVRAIH